MPLPSVNPQPLGTPFVELQSIDSTNNYALAQVHANLAQPGTCYFAHDQTSGKGQRGKSWATEKGANIILSLVLKPSPLQPLQQFHLSICVAVATHAFLSRFTHDDLRIKWPNDLYWKDRKLGGILIENIIGPMETSPSETQRSFSNWKWAVVGIGININQSRFPKELKDAVSLRQITGTHYDPVALGKELCRAIDESYTQLSSQGIHSLLKGYNRVLYKKNELVKFKKGTRSFFATAISVNESGQLIIQHTIEEKINPGEVEWVVPV